MERTIQSLQEKLSLIIHDPACTVDWKIALPTAVLSLNTTTHESTGYSPFELLFGRAHWEHTSEALEKNRRHSDYAELRERRASENLANASASINKQQSLAKIRFDARHRQVVFKPGDEVYVRQAGRITKLQNRFAGPYIVMEGSNDIYRVERTLGTRKEMLRRHAKDLKLCRRREDRGEQSTNSVHEKKGVMSVFVCLAMHLCIGQTRGESFVEAPLVSWRQMPANVSPRLTTFQLGIYYRSPCVALRQFQPPELREVELAVAQCESIFRSLITEKLATFASWHSTQPQVRVPASAGNRVIKRSLTDIIIGAFASNIITTIVDRIWPNGQTSELERRVQLLDQQTQSLNSRLNFTSMEIGALRDGQQILAKLVEHNIQVLDAVKRSTHGWRW